MLVRVHSDDTSTTVQDLIDDAVGDHRIADGLGSIWQDQRDLGCLVIRLAVEAQDETAAERDARRIVAEALLEAGQTSATTEIRQLYQDARQMEL
jgi:hypothetical protein